MRDRRQRLLGRVRDDAHFNHFDVTFAGTIEASRTRVDAERRTVATLRVAEVGERLSLDVRADALREGRNRAGLVVGRNCATRTVVVHLGNPDVERRQVQVEVEHFAAVIAFKETYLDSLAFVVRVDYGEQRAVAAADGVVRIDENLTQTIGIQVDSARHVRNAGYASDTGDDGSRQTV